ncbi:MAG: FixH family protein [Chloroflexi bacterium]|nr:FixH family protein [Chloroflexota bacterium]
MTRVSSTDWRLIALAGALLAVALLAACAPATGAPASGKPPASVTLTPEPTAPVADQDVTLKIRLADADAKGVPGAKVKVSATHTEMAHGSLEADASDAGSGDYVAKLKPNMAGTWKLTVTAQGGGATKRADFELQVR